MMNSGGGHSGSSQDFDLNLAPIIDCFTVLITFLLISASFLSIGILDAGISAPGAQTESEPQGASVDLTLKITADRGYRIKIEGTQPGSGRESEESIKSAKPLDLAALAQKLQALHQQYPKVDVLTLAADEAIEYRDIVATLATARKVFPAVLIGGEL